MCLEEEDIEPVQPLNFFFKPAEYELYPKLSTRCETFNFMEIFRKLDVSEKIWFKNHMQFKHIFHMFNQKNRMVMGMWMLLLYTAVTDKKRQCWFVVSGVPIWYSIREHGLLSGLFCPHYPADYENLGNMAFVEKHFPKKHCPVKMIDVCEKLKSMEFDGGFDRLKMAVLYFLSIVIKGRSKKIGGCKKPFILLRCG